MSTNPLEELRQQAGHDMIRECRAAIGRMQEWLESPHRQEVLGLLQERLRKETVENLRDEIRQLLDDDERRNPGQQIGGKNGNVVQIQCPNCNHIRSYNRQQLCQDYVIVFMAPERSGPADVRLTCPDCGTVLLHASTAQKMLAMVRKV